MDPLKIVSVDFLMEVNAAAHHTHQFVSVLQKRDVVLRRGQVFFVQFQVQGRDFDADLDLVRLTFSFGADGKTVKNTKGVVTVGAGTSPSSNSWSCRVDRQRHGAFVVKLISPPDMPVGVWMCGVDLGVKGSSPLPSKLAIPVYFLFNPWAREDSTYMPEEELLDEYVLNDVGKIWIGAHGSARGRQWVFGQFDKYVLPACILLLERTNLPSSARGDPVKVSRAISKLVNANDDRGVVAGKWSSPYTGGTPPAAWTGSPAILKQYLLTGKEVCYGQCWVFAGVLNTVCRALGLPARVVSNLVSAHDTDASLTIDRFYNEDLEAIESEGSEDSIWNFHVWNDVWMARPSLPKGYGGWQAVDATPQETSDGVYQCGPASVGAVRSGEISHDYDTGFVYASVNADLIRWKEDTSTDFGFIRIQASHDHIGKMILTKKPFLFDPNGEQDREDITEQYKHVEGSIGERLVVSNAVSKSDRAKRFYPEIGVKGVADVEFKLVHLERIMIGENYTITMQIKNTGSEARSVRALLSSSSVFYTGLPAHDVKSVSTQLSLPPGSREELSSSVTAAEYLPYLVEYGIMKIRAICTVCDTHQSWAEEDDFQVLKPQIVVKVLDDLVVNSPCRLQFWFVNPLSLPLTKPFFSFEAPGISKSRMIRIGEVGPKAEASTTYPITPKQAGKFRLVTSFYSKQLYDVTGSAELDVTAKSLR